jgi:tyrosine aminotransferase
MRIARARSNIAASALCHRTFNPIREIVDRLDVKPPEDRPMIPLSIGDPTVFGNFSPPPELSGKVAKALEAQLSNGYVHASGIPAARAALAKKYSLPRYECTADDVLLTSGCSSAIDLALQAVCNERDVIAIPRPSFSLYRTLAVARGMRVVTYELDPDRQWEANLESLDAALEVAKAVIFNNPSNPCGSVWSRQHCEEVAKLAGSRNVVVIADEIYADMTFGDPFTPHAEVAPGPTITVGGLAKQFMVPGWRVGWIVLHDPTSVLDEVRYGLHRLATLTLGPTSVLQAVVPDLLATPQDYFDGNLRQLATNADVLAAGLAACPGVEMIRPRGAMYALLRVDCAALGVEDDVAFARAVLAEEGVFYLPGQCFEAPGFVRAVLAAPASMLTEAADRTRRFCEQRFRAGA